ncbi:MAG TPA: hypothetical protein VKQ30_20710 [Ktedonobacterales bacterium]|nr:hypothetical protein [Ktedonobacterales bacterium]
MTDEVIKVAHIYESINDLNPDDVANAYWGVECPVCGCRPPGYCYSDSRGVLHVQRLALGSLMPAGAGYRANGRNRLHGE